ncbi:hypothetical protein DRO24_01165 [Candidatus Bathyarchaeota archaeon]|nr:MAG: hypothetical protein DRO24_01165 [Candidatus Bathyarchaeota archaeon]
MSRPLRFLVDENLPLSLVEFLRSRGFKAVRVSEVGLKGAEDSTIAEYALNNDYIIVTLDKDFGYIYHSIYRNRLTIILIRTDNPLPNNVISILNNALNQIDVNKHMGRLIILTRNRVRII